MAARQSQTFSWSEDGLSFMWSILTSAFVLAISLANEPAGPRPVAAWAAGPLEVRVAFDRAADSASVQRLVGQTIAFGDQAVKVDWPDRRKAVDKGRAATVGADGGRLKIAAARLKDAGRTLVLATDPHPLGDLYVLGLPPMRAVGTPMESAAINVGYDLHGFEVAWDDGKPDAVPSWTGWWPHGEPDVVRSMTKGSAEHERSLTLLAQPGHLSLRTQLALPAGKGALMVRASAPVTTNLGEASGESTPGEDGGHRVSLEYESTGDPVEFVVEAKTGAGGPLELRIAYQSPDTRGEQRLAIEQFLLPWVPIAPAQAGASPAPPFSLAGGDSKRGEIVFASEEAKCANCHKVRGKGGDVGPDLSNLASRDLALIYRDINEPSVTINPEFVPYTLALKNGQVLAGVVRAEGADQIRVTDTNANATLVKRSELDELRPSATSIMPVGLAGVLGEDKLRDLIAYLTMTTGRK
jgi:putative heme-binding domain-containing protein